MDTDRVQEIQHMFQHAASSDGTINRKEFARAFRSSLAMVHENYPSAAVVMLNSLHIDQPRTNIY